MTRPISGSGEGYRAALGDDASLAMFLRAMGKFDRFFCDSMANGEDFTLRLEVRGDKGKLLHVRCMTDGFERPLGSSSKHDC